VTTIGGLQWGCPGNYGVGVFTPPLWGLDNYLVCGFWRYKAYADIRRGSLLAVVPYNVV